MHPTALKPSVCLIPSSLMRFASMSRWRPPCLNAYTLCLSEKKITMGGGQGCSVRCSAPGSYGGATFPLALPGASCIATQHVRKGSPLHWRSQCGDHNLKGQVYGRRPRKPLGEYEVLLTKAQKPWSLGKHCLNLLRATPRVQE